MRYLHKWLVSENHKLLHFEDNQKDFTIFDRYDKVGNFFLTATHR